MSNEMIRVPRELLQRWLDDIGKSRHVTEYAARKREQLCALLSKPESASGKLPPIGRQAMWQAIDEALVGTVEPMLRGDICNILAALLAPAEQHQDKPLIHTTAEKLAMLRGELKMQDGGLTYSRSEPIGGWTIPLYTRPGTQPVGVQALLAEIERLKGLRSEAPPRPPEGQGLPRYGLRWNGPQQPLATPMDDGYWTPWHLANVLHKDAERYRWLRDKSESVHSFYLSVPIWFSGVRFRKDDVDSAIDAAKAQAVQP